MCERERVHVTMARPRSTSNRLFISRELLRILYCIFAARPCLCWVCVRLSVLCLCSIVELHEQVLDVRIKITGIIAEIVSNSTICVCQPDPRCFGFVAFAHQVSWSSYSCLSRQFLSHFRLTVNDGSTRFDQYSFRKAVPKKAVQRRLRPGVDDAC